MTDDTTNPIALRHIFSVSELTGKIKALLEEKYAFIWISGEISNFKIPSSGHCYFTLKDNSAQISAVIFRGQKRNLRFLPENGMRVTGLGRLAVYPPRGTYQVIFELLEPDGIGALKVAFEQLKAKLSAQGLFDDAVKLPIPFLPTKIGIVTSPTGAVIHDMVSVINRRFFAVALQILAVRVQGDGAETEIARAIERINDSAPCDLIILARGGGSFEDLQPFNTEVVARAIFNSRIPIISAVGHETDFTIADFTADLRAPTPSAAAELAVPLRAELKQQCNALAAAMKRRLDMIVEMHRQRLAACMNRMTDPRKQAQTFRLRIDELTQHMIHCMATDIRHRRERLGWTAQRMALANPGTLSTIHRQRLGRNTRSLKSGLALTIDRYRSKWQMLHASLTALDPKAILNRGYSITRRVSDSAVVRHAVSVRGGEELDITLARGELRVRVTDR
jgi:exodeoxyribonuclease VII large subunit